MHPHAVETLEVQVLTFLSASLDDNYKSCITLRTLNYGNNGIFLVMGNAGFVSSAVPVNKLHCIRRVATGVVH